LKIAPELEVHQWLLRKLGHGEVRSRDRRDDHGRGAVELLDLKLSLDRVAEGESGAAGWSTN